MKKLRRYHAINARRTLKAPEGLPNLPMAAKSMDVKSKNREQQTRMLKELRRAMIYPALILSIALIELALMVIYFIPALNDLMTTL